MSFKELPVKIVKVSEIKPYPKNVKQHSRKQVEQIVKSMGTYGITQDIVIDEGNVVVIGHARLLALQEAGVKDVAVKVLKGYTEEQKQALRILDNKLTESPWEKDNLAEALLAADGNGLFTGFEKDFISRLRIKHEEQVEPAYELTPLLHEKYDYVLLFFDDELDFLFASQVFGLKEMRDRFKHEYIGVCRAVRWKDAYPKIVEQVKRELRIEHPDEKVGAAK